MASGVAEWIKADETAKQMLSRVLTERPFLALPPPLHKLPLRVGNVVEIVGPPSSAKTHVLMQTMTSQLKKQKEAQGSGVLLLMFDSIGAFYWMDRARPSSSVGCNRKSMSLQSVTEVVVQEIQKLLLVNPVLVLASKTASLRNLDIKPSTNVLDMKDVMTYRTLLQHDYMPSVWQSFVSHRMLVYPSDDNTRHNSHPVYFTEWLLPSIKSYDKFIIKDQGVMLLP